MALGEGGLLLALRGLLLAHAPVTLDEELHHLYVASESSVNQGALAVLVQLVHLLAGHHLIRNTPSLTAHSWLHTLSLFTELNQARLFKCGNNTVTLSLLFLPERTLTTPIVLKVTADHASVCESWWMWIGYSKQQACVAVWTIHLPNR